VAQASASQSPKHSPYVNASHSHDKYPLTISQVRGLTHIALVSRDSKRLAQDEDAVYSAIQERGYSCQVKTWTCDLTDFEQLDKTLGEIEKFGSVECVLFNAARVAGKPPLEESLDAITLDFRVSTSLLNYKTGNERD